MKINEDYVTVDVPMAQILSDATFNCRGKLVPADVMDLAADIRARGLDQPIIVQPYDKTPGKKYRIVAGHRRHMAFRLLEMETIPARIRDDLKDLEANVLNLGENLKRRDLTIVQEANGLLPFKKAKWTEQAISAQLGVSRGWVQTRLMLLELPEDIQNEAAVGNLTQDHIRKLYTLRSRKEDLYNVVKRLKERKENAESTKIIIPSKPNAHRKKFRQPHEVFELQERIQKTMGNSFATQVLGWAGGANSDYEIHKALRDESAKVGKIYEIPEEILRSI